MVVAQSDPGIEYETPTELPYNVPDAPQLNVFPFDAD